MVKKFVFYITCYACCHFAQNFISSIFSEYSLLTTETLLHIMGLRKRFRRCGGLCPLPVAREGGVSHGYDSHDRQEVRMLHRHSQQSAEQWRKQRIAAAEGIAPVRYSHQHRKKATDQQHGQQLQRIDTDRPAHRFSSPFFQSEPGIHCSFAERFPRLRQL